MEQTRFTFFSPVDTPDFEVRISGVARASWPEFMLNDPIADLCWEYLYSSFPEYQFALQDTQTGKVAAVGNSVALNWNEDVSDLPDGGWDWAFQQSVSDYQNGLRANTQCAIQIMIHPDYRGQGLSSMLVQKMRNIGQEKGFQRLIAPVRPNLKSMYPLIEIDQYIHWQTAQQLPFDPWLRVHARAGAKIIKPCHHSMEIRASSLDWEKWTGMKFPESGKYVIPGGLVPMEMDKPNDLGIYNEPNVWTVHDLRDTVQTD